MPTLWDSGGKIIMQFDIYIIGNGNLYGAIEFYRELEIKPIIGIDLIKWPSFALFPRETSLTFSRLRRFCTTSLSHKMCYPNL
jgi:hypothetical protein